MKQTPTSDSGMVKIGTSTERNEPRKIRITSTTMTTASAIVLNTSSIEAADVVAGVVDELELHARRQLALDLRQLGRAPPRTVSSALAPGEVKTPRNVAFLAR